MSEIDTLHSMVALFRDQRDVTHSLWVMYAVTTFTAAAFSFKNGARWPLSLAVAVGFLAFTVGHGVLVFQSIESTNALSEAINTFAATLQDSAANIQLKTSPSIKAAVDIAGTANSPWYSMIAHGVIDICVCVLIIFGRDMSDSN